MKLSHSKKVASKQLGNSKNIRPSMILGGEQLAQAADVITVAKAASDYIVPAVCYYFGLKRSNKALEVSCDFKTALGTKCKHKANIIQGEYQGIEQQLIQCTKIKGHVRPLSDNRKKKRLVRINSK